MRYIFIISLFFCTHTSYCQKVVALNEIQKNSVRFYIGFQKVNEQFNYIRAAQKFNTETIGNLLQQVEIHRAIIPINYSHSISGEPASTAFILRIYDIDSLNGSPGKSLIKETLTIKNEANPIVKIDLRKYKIIIPGKTFFVGIEWIFNERNQRVMRNKPDQTIKDKQYEVADLIYQPFLGMIKNNKSTSDAWVMTPDGKWKLYTHNLPYMTDLSITAYIISK